MYVCMYIYCGFVLAVGSASDGSSTKQLKKKMLKLNHIKIVIFRNQFSCSLRYISLV